MVDDRWRAGLTRRRSRRAATQATARAEALARGSRLSVKDVSWIQVHSRELQLVEAFVRKGDRERQSFLVSSKRRRAEFIEQLYHFRGALDDRFVAEMGPGTDLRRRLRAMGAGGTCYLISVDAELDGREMEFDHAVVAAETTEGTILDCIPGRIAYYHGEEPSEGHWLLVRPAN